MRPPRSLTPQNAAAMGLNVLEYEVVEEKVSALAEAGRKAEKAMAALRAFDENPTADGDRQKLVDTAAHIIWGWFIQRELCGMRNHKPVIKELGIPPEVLNRMGVMPKY